MKNPETIKEGEPKPEQREDETVFGFAAKVHWIVLGVVGMITLFVWLWKMLK